MKKKNVVSFAMLLPSLAGVLIFYCIPFFLSFFYTVINNMADRKWIGFENYKNMLSDPLFLQAVRNTLVFMALSVPLSMMISLVLAMNLQKLKKGAEIVGVALTLPVMLPSGTIVHFWKILFDTNGLVNKISSCLGLGLFNLSDGTYAMAVITLLFLWKNVGYNIILFWSGLNWIPKVYYEIYRMESSSSVGQFWHVTWVYLSPTTFLVLLMSIVNSFKVFKEIYQLCGSYPTPQIYMLQHYLNNQFSAMNMQKLCTAAWLIFAGCSLVLLVVYLLQKKTSDTFS
jgi:multiple sugar transport system permease protein